MTGRPTNLDLCQRMAQWLYEPQPAAPHWPQAVWSQFQTIAHVHGVAPLLAKKLATCSWLPEKTGQWLTDQYALNQSRIIAMQADLQAILALFGRHTVPVMLLKGACLITHYLPDPALRPMADLDLLVHPQDYQRALQLLDQLGYEPAQVNWKHTELGRPHNRAVVSWTGEHPDNPRKVDLHLACREMFSGPVVDLTEALWATATTKPVLGETAVIPGRDLLWLHLVIHTSNHIWGGNNRLINLWDIKWLTEHPANTAIWHLTEARMVFLALWLTAHTFPGVIDTKLLSTIAAQTTPRLQRWVQTFDLVNTSHLKERPLRRYPANLLTFYNHPRDVRAALQFALHPESHENNKDSNHENRILARTADLQKKARLIYQLLRLK